MTDRPRTRTWLLCVLLLLGGMPRLERAPCAEPAGPTGLTAGSELGSPSAAPSRCCGDDCRCDEPAVAACPCDRADRTPWHPTVPDGPRTVPLRHAPEPVAMAWGDADACAASARWSAQAARAGVRPHEHRPRHALLSIWLK